MLHSRSFLTRKRGVTGLGYGLMIGLISIVALAAITGIGDQVDRVLGGTAVSLTGAASTTGSPEIGITVQNFGSYSAFSDGFNARSCKGYLDASDNASASGNDTARQGLAGGQEADSGVYRIDPDGDGGNAPFDIWCDMATDGGGWTLSFRMDSLDSGDSNVDYFAGIGAGTPSGWLTSDSGTSNACSSSCAGEGPTLADRAALWSGTGASEYRATAYLDTGPGDVFDVRTSGNAVSQNPFYCAATGCGGSMTNGSFSGTNYGNSAHGSATVLQDVSIPNWLGSATLSLSTGESYGLYYNGHIGCEPAVSTCYEGVLLQAEDSGTRFLPSAYADIEWPMLFGDYSASAALGGSYPDNNRITATQFWIR